MTIAPRNRPNRVPRGDSALSRCLGKEWRDARLRFFAATLRTFVSRRMFADALDQFKLMAAVLAKILIDGHDTPPFDLRLCKGNH